MRLIKPICILAVLFLLAPADAPAHPSADARVEALDAVLAERPADPDLLLARAEAHRILGHWTQAMADLDAAERHPGRSLQVMMGRARVLADMGRESECLTLLDRILSTDPHEFPARELRSTMRQRTGDIPGALADAELLLTTHPSPGAEGYLRRAGLQALAGDSPQVQRLGLLEGLDSLGPAPPLVFALADLDLDLGLPGEALASLDRLAPNAEHAPWFLRRRGDILRRAGQELEAQATYTTALEQLQSTPGGKRTHATDELHRYLRAQLRVPPQPGATP